MNVSRDTSRETTILDSRNHKHMIRFTVLFLCSTLLSNDSNNKPTCTDMHSNNQATNEETSQLRDYGRPVQLPGTSSQAGLSFSRWLSVMRSPDGAPGPTGGGQTTLVGTKCKNILGKIYAVTKCIYVCGFF